MTKNEFILRVSVEINKIFGLEVLTRTGDIVQSEEMKELLGENDASQTSRSGYEGINCDTRDGVSIWRLGADFMDVDYDGWNPVMQSKIHYTEEDVEQIVSAYLEINRKWLSALRFLVVKD